jgi:hypothetical protein
MAQGAFEHASHLHVVGHKQEYLRLFICPFVDDYPSCPIIFLRVVARHPYSLLSVARELLKRRSALEAG